MAAGSTGPNTRPLDDTVAETGPGFPDDAVTPGELAPTDVDEAELEAAAAALEASGWAPRSESPGPEVDGVSATTDAEAETEAHPT